jgi:GxxExxY protein
MKIDNLTHVIIGKAIEVHRILGPGLLESAYQECLFYELTTAGLIVEKQVPMPVIYKELELDQGYRIDLLVNQEVVVENKCVEMLKPVHTAQILTYLKLSGCHIGLLINFHSKLLKNGIKRFIL